MKVFVQDFNLYSGGNFNALLDRVRKVALKAKAESADALLLPEFVTFELLSCFDSQQKKQECIELASGYGEKWIAALSSTSVETGVAIIGASIPLFATNKLLNVAGFFSKDGKYVLQSKLFLTPDEIDLGFSAGNSLQVFELEGLRCCILICLDCEIPAVSAALSGKNLDVIFVPSMVNDLAGVQRVYGCSLARAIEHTCYVVGTGAGSEEGYYQSHSYFIPPQVPPFEGRGFSSRFEVASSNVFKVDRLLLQQALKSSSTVRPGFVSAGLQINVLEPTTEPSL